MLNFYSCLLLLKSWEMNTEVHADVKLVVVFLRSFKHAKILFAFECELHLLGKHFVLISNQIFTTEYPLIKL